MRREQPRELTEARTYLAEESLRVQQQFHANPTEENRERALVFSTAVYALTSWRPLRTQVFKDYTRASYMEDRPWKVTPDGIDKRDSYYPTWEEAMAWATMDPDKKQAEIDYEAKFEMGG